MDLMSAVRRLERLGSADGRATKKLHESAATLAAEIIAAVPAGVALPRGYMVVRVESNVGWREFLVLRTGSGADDKEYWIDGTGGYLHGDFCCSIPDQTRRGSLQFAEDVATGLIDEINEVIQVRSARAQLASAQLVARTVARVS